MNQNKVYVKEIFESVQGEGPYIGVNQLFIRFSDCNLHCGYCDTDFKSELSEYTKEQLLNEINKHKNIHSISLTGGEPLMNADFLFELLPDVKQKIYLETNGTLCKELQKIIDYVDIIAMDIKLSSAAGMPDLFGKHEEFIKTAIKKELFLKVVFNEKITESEINKTVELAEKYKLPVILQPQSAGDSIKNDSATLNKIFYTFLNKYENVRLIPQVHKFLNVR
jgi:organic radical activating enzyme